MANTKFEVILGIPFLKLSNVDVSFGKGTLIWKCYTTKQVQLIDSQEFVIAALDVNSKTFVVHVAIREREEMVVDPGRKTQIEA